MVPAATHHRRRHLLGGVLAGLAMIAVAAATMASPAPAKRPTMSVEFAAPTARLAGPGAVVLVKCRGIVTSTCVGTLTLEGPGGSHEAPFSIATGRKQIVVVPLGSEQRLYEGIASARAVADTLQVRGSSVRTARQLRIR